MAACKVRRLSRGDVVYAIGDQPGGVYGLVEGGLSVSYPAPGRGTFFAQFAVSGWWFGVGSILTGEPRRVTIEATRPTVLAYLPIREIDVILEQQPELWRWFGVLAMMNLDLALGAAEDLAIRNPRQRCAAVLLRLATGHADTPAEVGAVEVDVTQGEFATMTNLSRNAAGGVLREWTNAGLVAMRYGRVRVLDFAGLQRIRRGKRVTAKPLDHEMERAVAAY
ncbi:MAG: Crp/Fnr family transcriptional regulator [Pseudomonadota bacterium]